MVTSEIASALSKSPLFAGLGSQSIQHLQARCHLRHFDRGDIVFVQGASAERFFLVVDGWVVIRFESQGGDSTVVHVVGPGEFLAAPAALHLRRFPATSEAATEVNLVEVPASLYRSLLTEHPELALGVIANLSARLHGLVQELGRRQLLSTRKRVAAFLLEHAPPEGAAAVTLPYEKGLIAARLGMEPQTFSRALASLRRQGVQSGRGPDVSIEDISVLRRYLESDA